MNSILFLLGSSLLIYSLRFPGRMEIKFSLFYQNAKIWFNSLTKAPELDQECYLLVSKILALLRSGHSLDSALHYIQLQKANAPKNTPRISRILSRQPDNEPVSRFLVMALNSGCSLIEPLQSLQSFLNSKTKLFQKSYAITAQYRGQANVLSWMPLFMILVVLLLDPSMISQGAQSSLTLLFLSFTLFLVGLGRIWISTLVESVLAPSNCQEEFKSNIYPEILLQMIGATSLGSDALTALEEIQAYFRSQKPTIMLAIEQESFGASEDSYTQLQQAVAANSIQGGPIQSDLKRLMVNHFSEQESYWEGKVQRLPILLLAPLFLCFFPSCIFTLLALLMPTILEVL